MVTSWRLQRKYEATQKDLTSELKATLEGISQTHNALVESVAAIDKKATETQLQLQMSRVGRGNV